MRSIHSSIGLPVSLLQGNVATSGATGSGTGPSVGGTRPFYNNFTVEGIDTNNRAVTGPVVTIPNDAIGEFTVIANQFAPEFGHSSGGQFNAVIKSGEVLDQAQPLVPTTIHSQHLISQFGTKANSILAIFHPSVVR